MIVNQPGEPNGNGIGSTSPPHLNTLGGGEPVEVNTDDRTIAQLCDEYLSSLHAASWGRSFYITSDDGRRDAAEFIAKTIEGVMEHAKSRRS